MIYGILPGNKNVSLWCSTNRGLVKLTPNTNTSFSFDITTFTATKGLQDNEFNTQAFFKAANGELLFGGVNGLNRFFPEELRSGYHAAAGFCRRPGNQPPARRFRQAPAAAAPSAGIPARIAPELRPEQPVVRVCGPGFHRPVAKSVSLPARGAGCRLGGNGRQPLCPFHPPGAGPLRIAGAGQQRRRSVAGSSITRLSSSYSPPWWRSNLAYLLYFLLLYGRAGRPTGSRSGGCNSANNSLSNSGKAGG